MMMSVLVLLSALCFAMGNVVPAATNYCAQIVASQAMQAVGYFSMQINQGMANYNFNLDLSKYTPSGTCDLSQGLMYHIHVKWTNATSDSAASPTLCGALVTGLHYDPNLACGYTSAQCTALGRSNTQLPAYNCTKQAYNAGNYAQCQVGDLSGKFGIVYGVNNVFSQAASVVYDLQPPYAANYLVANSISSAWSSIVFHCVSDNGSKQVCAKFKLVPSGSLSACSFPTILDAVALNTKVGTQKTMIDKETIAIIVLAVFLFVFIVLFVTFATCYGMTRAGTKSELELLAPKDQPAPEVGVNGTEIDKA